MVTRSSDISENVSTIVESQELNQPLIIRSTPSAGLVEQPPVAASTQRLRWQEGTVDNEFMGKRKSKCCCIYKKPRRWDESSSSSSSSSSSDDGDDDDKGEGGGAASSSRGHTHRTHHCRGHTKGCYHHKAAPSDNDDQPQRQEPSSSPSSSGKSPKPSDDVDPSVS